MDSFDGCGRAAAKLCSVVVDRRGAGNSPRRDSPAHAAEDWQHTPALPGEASGVSPPRHSGLIPIGDAIRPLKRLGLSRRIVEILRHGQRARTGVMSIAILRNSLGYNRLCIRSKRGRHGAVARNRARRLVRETCRLHNGELLSGFDLIIHVDAGRQLSLSEAEREFRILCGNVGIIR